MKGLGISSGIGIGKVYLYEEPEIIIEDTKIKNITLEINKLDNALKIALEQIDNLYNIAYTNIGEKEAEVFIAHKMILKDPEFIESIKGKISDEYLNCAKAVKEISDYFIDLLGNVEDEYLKERAFDIKDVSDRLLRIILGIKYKDLSTISEKYIVVARDLTPSNTAMMNKEMIEGIVTEIGGRTSHTAIMAKTLEIPAVLGISNVTKLVKHEDLMIVDGTLGECIIHPSEEEILNYKNKEHRQEQEKKELLSLINSESISIDGYKVDVAGNIGSAKDVSKVIENGGEGVGLFRTEFLYMDKNKMPTEEEQFETYKVVAGKLKGKPLVIRTLDVGGDKDIPYLNLPKEMNPFLGVRAIRLCLEKRDIFKIQLKAILRASSFGNIKIMFPMVSSIEELRDSKSILDEVKSELKKDRIAFDDKIEIGIMVEIPSVAIQSETFAKEVDFFSIGTNDLVQYTVAVDRGNQNLSHLYTHYHPAVLKLIKMTIENGHKEGIWVGMCGEAAADEKFIPILLAMGLDEFSVSASSILKTRHVINKTSKKEIALKLDEILCSATARDVEKY